MIKKSMAARTARIQGELDGAAEAKAAAASRGDADPCRQGRHRRRACSHPRRGRRPGGGGARGRSGPCRVRSCADLEARTVAEIAATGNRAGDELRAEIARLSNAAVDHVVTGSLDDATQQELIESFISRVGAAK